MTTPSRLAWALLSMLLPALPAMAQQPGVALIDTAVLAAPGLEESSGIAVSDRHPGIYWTINDSGNRPLLHATDSAGRDLGFVRLLGVNLIDWEDLSIGPCPGPGGRSGPCLYVADIGDNNAERRRVVVYVVPEPEAPRASTDTLRTVSPVDSFILRYPDGPHDAEAMAITADRWLLVVTKDRSGAPELYRTPLDSTGPHTLRLVAALPISVSIARGRLVTGAAVSPDGRWLAARTYSSLHLFRLAAGGRAHALVGRTGIVIPVVEVQGEAIAFEGNDRLVLTSERGSANHGIVTRLRLFGMPDP